ncbi:outer membrane beta-barrel protein [Cognatitamlana onchidii]|uniref:outer membrane beta-barrel protein n=1 Tax=Cognatitamlana onchidii TaxID=2562860 RepID=UPI0010A6101F|nr:outer membrane beta-barrel protein [Algibacter onchidii]
MTRKITFTKTYAASFLMLIAFIFSTSGNAQTVEIIPSYGYQFGAKASYGANYLKLKDGGQWGVSVGFETFDDTMVEVSYIRQDSEIRLRDIIYSPVEERLTDVAGDWIMVGGSKYFPNGNIRPFVGGALGVVIVSPKNENRDAFPNIPSYGSDTNFAFSFKGGVNIMFSEHVGINLQGNLLFPVNWGGFYVGTGGGGVSVSSTMVIGGVSGGLVFRI